MIFQVITMLLGEYNFTANFIVRDINSTVKDQIDDTNGLDSPINSAWWGKLVFMIFVFDMSVVLMNLILGMAVSDIDELQRSSEVKRIINECFIVKNMEDIIYCMAKVIPCLDRFVSF